VTPPTSHPSRPRRLAIIGSTGSIGRSALDVVRQHRHAFEVVALAAHSAWEELAAQAAEFTPRCAALADPQAARALASSQRSLDVRAGAEGVASLAALDDIDTVLLAVVGIAGLAPALAAVRNGKRLALATKEVLVAAGPLVLQEARRNGAEVLPVDSEHSAILQCAQSAGARGVESIARVVLTASGGPFRTRARDALRRVTPAEALAHPTWNMGNKITIDSATLMNKGLEVIEAHRLFDVRTEQIEVVIHPQSIVHSLVEFCDGSVVAQLSEPDMRIPIMYALGYPERRPLRVTQLDLARIGELTFFEPDYVAFPCLGLAYEALRMGGTAPAVLNAANEVAVEQFLNGVIGFLDIPRQIERKLSAHRNVAEPSLGDILAADAWAREDSQAVAQQV
jgi:1-deoxy-D-xylulose-5-phosphate reductoisomerase